MTTPPALPEIDRRPPRKRTFALWLIPLAALGIVTALLLPPIWSDVAPPAPERLSLC
jgi:hypothetical protein